MLRRVLTVSGLAGAFVGAGLIAASAAQADDQPAHTSTTASARPDAGERHARHGLLSGVGKSVGALLGAEKPDKQDEPVNGPVNEPLASERDGAAEAAHRDPATAPRKASVPRETNTSSPARQTGGQQPAATPSDKGSAPVGNGGLVGRVVAPSTERAGTKTEPVTTGLGKATEPVTAPLAEVVGHVAAPVTEPVGRALAPVTRSLAPVTDALAPMTAPVARAAAPVTGVLAPVTSPLLRPVTKPLAPVTEPVASGSGLTPVTTPVGLTPEPGAPAPEPGSGDGVPVPGTSVPPAAPATLDPAAPAGSAATTAPSDGGWVVGPAASVAAPSWNQGQGGAATETAGGQVPSGDYDFPAFEHRLPAGTTGAISSSSSTTGGVGTAGALVTSAAAGDTAPHSYLASTAWDVSVGGLVYDGRGPRIPG
ncbi:hypothetical protein [Streptomyces sp. NPDC047065]|uniref:hypothetical protein n=1 Tax=Streptomyces sp. NPDC047065 TaxID=3154606 RepID=UPI0033C3DD23